MDVEIDWQNTTTTPATIAELTEAIQALVANQAMLQPTIPVQQQEIINLQTRQATVTSYKFVKNDLSVMNGMLAVTHLESQMATHRA
ncbi:hypothetical protein HDU84_001306, partial [Entophlyctis sp. JEL0112]